LDKIGGDSLSISLSNDFELNAVCLSRAGGMLLQEEEFPSFALNGL